MLYQGSFRSIQKDKLYTVDIITNGSSGTTVPITLGPDAFVTNMDSGSNTIYVPVKYQSATIQVVSDNYYFDMYSSTPKQNIVTLKDASSNVLWSGYISCNVYDADYNFVTESWQVECVDRLSVLKNYDYILNNGSTKDFVSFSTIIHNALSLAGFTSTDRWYISTSTHIPGVSYLVDNLYISESNFFDEDEEPMKMNEVLEEICKFMGVTCVADGNTVYFLDYDAIKAGNQSYNWYYVGSTTKHSSTLTSKVSHTIAKSSYAATGARLSLDNVYSKVIVRDSLYPVKSIIPSLFEDEDLRNVQYVDEENQNWNYEYNTSTVCDADTKKKDDDTYFQIRSKFYTNTKYNHSYYTNSGSSTTGPIMNMLAAENLTGVAFAKFNIGSGKNSSQAYANMDYDGFENYLMIPINKSGVTGLTRLESKTEFSKPFFMSGRTKLIAKGTMILTDRGQYPNASNSGNVANIGYWPSTGSFFAFDDLPWWQTQLSCAIKNSALTLNMTVNIGDGAKSFKVPFYPYGEGNSYIVDTSKTSGRHEIFYAEHGVQDTVTYFDKIKEKGFVFNMNINDASVFPAKPIITIGGVDDLVSFNMVEDEWGHFNELLACVFIKDFDIVAVDPYEGGDESVNATDTEYCYTINDDFAQELPTIEFKVCTADGKSLNYSSVAWKNQSSGKYQFVENLVNDALSSKLQSDGESSAKRPEELMCYKLVKQYSSPAKKLSINMFYDLVKPYTLVTEPSQSDDGTPLLNCSFIVNTMSYNYSTDIATCELVEKK